MHSEFISNLTPLIFIIFLTGAMTLIMGFYILQKGSKSLITISLASMLFIYCFNALTIGISLAPLSLDLSVIIYRLQWLTWIATIVVFYLISILTREKNGENLILQKKFFKIIVIPFSIILSILTISTNYIVDWNKPFQNYTGEIKVWFIYSNPAMVLLVLIRMAMCGLIIFNAFEFWRKTSNSFAKKRAFIVFISGLICALSISIGDLLAFLFENISSELTLELINFF
jgi:hypothetical protein